MADTTPAAFDPKPKVLGTVLNMIAGGTILKGDVVAIHGTPVSNVVWSSDTDSTAAPIGVALNGAVATEKVAVASCGSIIKVREGAGGAVDAGDMLMTYSVAGTVVTAVLTADCRVIGYAIGDIAANETGYAVILGPHYVAKDAT
jgi:hypothetical protein